jgi:hypothetical protein
MLRVAVAAALRANSAINGALPGGIYPFEDNDPVEMSRDTYPAAFDGFKQILPTLLVRDNGDVAAGPRPAHGASFLFDLLFWQAEGQVAIEEAQRRARILLDGGIVAPAGLYIYQVRYAGSTTDVRDPGLDGARHAIQGWQTFGAVKG